MYLAQMQADGSAKVIMTWACGGAHRPAPNSASVNKRAVRRAALITEPAMANTGVTVTDGGAGSGCRRPARSRVADG